MRLNINTFVIRIFGSLKQKIVNERRHSCFNMWVLITEKSKWTNASLSSSVPVFLSCLTVCRLSLWVIRAHMSHSQIPAERSLSIVHGLYKWSEKLSERFLHRNIHLSSLWSIELTHTCTLCCVFLLELSESHVPEWHKINLSFTHVAREHVDTYITAVSFRKCRRPTAACWTAARWPDFLVGAGIVERCFSTRGWLVVWRQISQEQPIQLYVISEQMTRATPEGLVPLNASHMTVLQASLDHLTLMSLDVDVVIKPSAGHWVSFREFSSLSLRFTLSPLDRAPDYSIYTGVNQPVASCCRCLSSGF